MNNKTSNEISPTTRTQLRDAVTNMAQKLERLSAPKGSGEEEMLSEVRDSWSALVQQLELRPEPEVRVCPRCNRTVMRAATLCGYCWMKLQPLPARPAA